MSAGWQSKALANVCEIKPPKGEAKRKLKETELVSFVPMEDLGIDQKYLEPKAERKLGQVAGSYTYFADGDVLLAKITPCFENGKLGIARGLTNGIGFGSSEYIVFRPTDDLSNEYLYYFLLQDNFRAEGIRTMSGAVGHKRVSKDFIERCQIPLPPLPEQQRIVAILDEAFAGLATATANVDKNLKNARELFDSYLNSIFRNSGEGWIEKTLGEVCQFQGGSQPPKSRFSHEKKKGYVRLIQIRDYKSDKFAVYIPKSLTKKFCIADDVMIGRYGPPLFQILRGLDGAYNVALMKAIPDERLLSKDFLFFFLKNSEILSYIIRSSSRAAGQSGINKETIEPYPIAFPSLPKQAEIVDLLRKREEECERLEVNYEQKLAALADLKQSILQKAFSGELTAPPTQAIKEAAE